MFEFFEETLDDSLDLSRVEVGLSFRVLRPCSELTLEFVLVVTDGTNVLTDLIDGVGGDAVDTGSGAAAVGNECFDFLDKGVDPTLMLLGVGVGGGGGGSRS